MVEKKGNKKRFGIVVDGILMPGFNSMDSAQTYIDKSPDLQKRGAIATPITGIVKVMDSPIQMEEKLTDPIGSSVFMGGILGEEYQERFRRCWKCKILCC